MGRKNRVVSDDDDSDIEPNVEAMSPEALKNDRLSRIMMEDLGNRNAEFITTTDYKTRHISHAPITRRCDIVGTEEYIQAQRAGGKQNQWSTYYQTEEAKKTTVGAKQPVGRGDGQTHRPRLTADLEGKPLPHTEPDRKNADQDHSSTSKKHKASSTRGKVQERPWPPPALKGLSVSTLQASAPHSSSNIPPGQTPSVPGSLDPAKGPPTPKKRAGSKPESLRHQSSTAASAPRLSHPPIHQFSLASPGAFMAAISQFQESKETSHVPALQDTTNHQTKSAVGSAKPLIESGNAENIKRVSVKELSFPAAFRLAPGDISTHTDGAQTPLSDFPDDDSTSVEETAVDDAKNVTGLNVMGIDDTFYPKASVEPVPIPNPQLPDSHDQTEDLLDFSLPKEALHKDLDPSGYILTLNGHRYIRDDAILELKSQFEALMAPKITQIKPVKKQTPIGRSNPFVNLEVSKAATEDPLRKAQKTRDERDDRDEQLASSRSHSNATKAPKQIQSPEQVTKAPLALKPKSTNSLIGTQWAGNASPGTSKSDFEPFAEAKHPSKPPPQPLPLLKGGTGRSGFDLLVAELRQKQVAAVENPFALPKPQGLLFANQPTKPKDDSDSDEL